MRADQARAYVESLLVSFVSGDRVLADQDGDYRVWLRNCLYFVRVTGHDTAVVQVFSVAVADVDASPELLTELNTLNAEIQFARAHHHRRQILIETEVLAEVLNAATFQNACSHVETVTLEMAPSLAARFGGRLTFANRMTLAAASAPAGIPAPPVPLPPVPVQSAPVQSAPVQIEDQVPTGAPVLVVVPSRTEAPEAAGAPASAEAPAAAEKAPSVNKAAPVRDRTPARKRAPAKGRTPKGPPTTQHR